MSRDFEESGCSHAAADAHRHDDELDAASLPFDECMAHETRACHAVRMADGDPSTVHVVDGRVDSELVAAVEHLASKRLIQFPQPDVADPQPMKLQQLRNGVDRSDAHLFGSASDDGHASIDAQRLE